jgi:hypothetical protein
MAIKPKTSKQEAAQISRGGSQPVTEKKTSGNKPPAGNSSGSLSAKQREAIKGLGGLTESLGGLVDLVGKLGSGDATGGPTGARTDASYIEEGRSGTSSTGKNYINGVLASPDEWATFLYGDNKGGGVQDAAEALRLKQERDILEAEKLANRKSAYDILNEEFTRYGLSSLIEPLKGLITEDVSPSEFSVRLRNSPAYQQRFSANTKRIAAGLVALSPAEYIQLEDQYQGIMRNYGLPATYYTKDAMGTQSGFNELLAGDVSATELEERLITAQDRVLKSNPEVLKALKDFYPDISNGDILAYTLDPKNALKDIQRKVTTAEIGGAAMQAGLNLGNTSEARAAYAARAAELSAAGITKQQAQEGFQTVAEVAPRGGQLAEIYKQNPYTQTTAEAEIFGLAGSTEAARQRKKLTSLETAAFSGSAGAGVIARDRAGVL